MPRELILEALDAVGDEALSYTGRHRVGLEDLARPHAADPLIRPSGTFSPAGRRGHVAPPHSGAAAAMVRAIS
jgi:hypothetical protein